MAAVEALGDRASAPDGSVTQPWLTNVLMRKVPMAVPDLFLAEVGGACGAAPPARRLGRADIGDKAIAQLLSIATLQLLTLDHAQGIEASRIAARYRLRGAAALYVAVAAHLNVPLISWDKEHISRVAGLIVAHTPEQVG